MENLVFVAEGDSETSRATGASLTVSARARIAEVGEGLKKMLEGRVVVATFTSIVFPERTAVVVESAKILGKIFGKKVEEHNAPICAPENALELVRSKADMADSLIIVAYVEYIREFLAYFSWANEKHPCTIWKRLPPGKLDQHFQPKSGQALMILPHPSWFLPRE